MKRIASFLHNTYLWILCIPLAISFFGIASNQAVLIANGDKFPVMLNGTKMSIVRMEQADADIPRLIYISVVRDGMIDRTHCLMTPQTHLTALADIFDLGSIYSIGDFGIMLGDWLWGFCPFIWVALVLKELKD